MRTQRALLLLAVGGFAVVLFYYQATARLQILFPSVGQNISDTADHIVDILENDKTEENRNITSSDSNSSSNTTSTSSDIPETIENKASNANHNNSVRTETNETSPSPVVSSTGISRGFSESVSDSGLAKSSSSTENSGRTSESSASPDVTASTTANVTASSVSPVTEGTVQDAVNHCLFGTVSVCAGGRLGNNFMEWASALAVARTLNLTLVLAPGVAGPLRHLFAAGVDAPTIGEFFRDQDRRLPSGRPCTSVVKDKQVENLAISFPDGGVSELRDMNPVILRKWIVAPEPISWVIDDIRGSVRFQQASLKIVDDKLRDIKEHAEAAGLPPEDLVFVGVHARRTDYPGWMKYRLKTNVVADEAYFVRAAVQLLTDLRRPPAAFVVVSDDMKWARKVLAPALDLGAGPDARAFAAGGGDAKTVHADLALLAACNHSIIAYGTYAMTAALLAGGRTVAFDVGVDWYPTSRFANILPFWKVIH